MPAFARFSFCGLETAYIAVPRPQNHSCQPTWMRTVGDAPEGVAMGSRTTLFADIDTMVPEAFARHLAEDVTMRFGNAPPMHGREACRAAWAEFCDLVDGVHHEVVKQWDVGDATIAETAVTYTR